MKILFVEDELSKNIPRVIRLFRKYLGKKRIQKLEEMESDDSGYGINPDRIKSIIEETNMIDIEYRFPDALNKVINQHDRYSLFIIDRNLVEAEYAFDEVQKIDSGFSKEQYERYFQREGDHLLYKLLLLHVDVKEKFYYLTAYSADDEIRGQEDMMGLLEHFGHFKKDNFIEKGSESDFAKLINRIDNIPVLSLQHENRVYLNILRNTIEGDMAERFLKVLQEKNELKRISDNLKELRIVYDHVLRKYSERIPAIQNQSGKDIINWLSDNKQINSIIRNFAYSIYGIGSDFGGHDSKEKRDIYSPTIDTVNALIYALKDIILWFKKTI